MPTSFLTATCNDVLRSRKEIDSLFRVVWQNCSFQRKYYSISVGESLWQFVMSEKAASGLKGLEREASNKQHSPSINTSSCDAAGTAAIPHAKKKKMAAPNVCITSFFSLNVCVYIQFPAQYRCTQRVEIAYTHSHVTHTQLQHTPSSFAEQTVVQYISFLFLSWELASYKIQTQAQSAPHLRNLKNYISPSAQ